MENQQENSKKIFCRCCLKALTQDESRIRVNDKTREIFFKFINFEIKSGNLCSGCNKNLLTFDAFQREIRRKHGAIAVEAQKGEKRARSAEKAVEYVAKRIKEENPLDIDDEPQNKHKSLPVEGDEEHQEIMSRKKKTPPGFEVRKLQKKPATAVKGRWVTSVRPIVKPKILTSGTFPPTSITAFIVSKPELPTNPSNIECHEVSLNEVPEDLQSDDDEVIFLPPEPPIDIENLDENSFKPKSENKMFKCDHCTAVSPKMEILIEHIKKSHRFQCVRKCGKVFPTIAKMREHFDQVHKDPRLGLVGSTKRKQCYMVKEVDDLQVLLK